MLTLKERLNERWNMLLCALFGHSKKLEKKMWCNLCSRCRMVVEHVANPPHFYE